MAGRLAQLERCRDAHEKALGFGQVPAKVAFALGFAYCDVGCLRQALTYLERALTAEEGQLRAEPGVYGEAAEALAYVYSVLEDADKEMQALDFAFRIYGLEGNKLAQAWMLVLKADFLLKTSDHKQRAAILRQAASLLEGLEEGRDLLKAVNCLVAATPSNRGGSKGSPEDEATGSYLRRFALASSADHVAGRRSLARELALAAALGRLGTDLADKKMSELEKVQKVVEALNRVHGPDHINTTRALMVLADMYGDQSDTKRKMETLQKILRIQEETFGFDSIFIACTLKGLAQVCGQLGETEKRLDALRRALELQEEELGSNHRQTTTTRFYLQEAQAESRRVLDPEGARELSELFGRRPPTNGKVNRHVGECTFPEGWDSMSSDRSVPPFQPVCTGGGSCAQREGGIDVPFYYNPMAPVA